MIIKHVFPCIWSNFYIHKYIYLYEYFKNYIRKCSQFEVVKSKISDTLEGKINKNLDEYLFNWGIQIFIGSKWKTFFCIKRFQMIFIKRYLSKMEIIKRFHWMNVDVYINYFIEVFETQVIVI